MKKNIFLPLIIALLFASCDKDDQSYPDGYDTHYYVTYNYNTSSTGSLVLQNSSHTIDKNTSTPLELQIKFMSENPRDFDVKARLYVRNSHYFLRAIGVTTPPENYFVTEDSLAVPGVDFQLLDKNMNVMTPVRGDSVTYYEIVFPNAQKTVETIYLQPLNNEDYNHIRCVWLSFALHKIETRISEEMVKYTSLNTDAGQYKLSTISNSYYRRINIR